MRLGGGVALWDRILHRGLVRSGKPTSVEKTPSDVAVWQHLATCWPDARFVFLLRHPYPIVRSWHEAIPEDRPLSEAVPRIHKYLEQARTALPGLTDRYGHLHRAGGRGPPHLRVPGRPGEPAMLSYGQHDHDTFAKGVGDWKDKIRTGTVQPGRPLPDPSEVPAELRPIAETWDYLSTSHP